MRHVPRHLQALQRRCDEARVERLAAGLSLDRHSAGAISDVGCAVCWACSQHDLWVMSHGSRGTSRKVYENEKGVGLFVCIAPSLDIKLYIGEAISNRVKV